MKQIYLDNAATTKMDKRVAKEMSKWMGKDYGNASSSHFFGIKANLAVRVARSNISTYLGAPEDRIFFTSGATESNNWVIQSLVYNELQKPEESRKDEIVVSAMEHNSVLQVCKFFTGKMKIRVVKNNVYGKIDLKNLDSLINKRTLLVCIMSLNNETGYLNPIEKIAKIVHLKNSLLLCDCTQFINPYLSYLQDSIGGGKKLCEYIPADFITFSAHKIHGPTGVGCLIFSKKTLERKFLLGGGQEKGLRAGTYNTAGIVGMATAIELLHKFDSKKAYCHYKNLCLYLKKEILKQGIRWKPNTFLSVSEIISLDLSKNFNSYNLAEEMGLFGIAVSSGSACDADGKTLSHVLKAMNKDERTIRNTVRISFSKYTTKRDIKIFVKVLKKIMEGEENQNEIKSDVR